METIEQVRRWRTSPSVDERVRLNQPIITDHNEPTDMFTIALSVHSVVDDAVMTHSMVFTKSTDTFTTNQLQIDRGEMLEACRDLFIRTRST